MKVLKKATAIILSAAMIAVTTVNAFAANGSKEGYGFAEHAVDNVFGVIQDGLFAALTAINLRFVVVCPVEQLPQDRKERAPAVGE
ncbi:MAG: hypothetical protein IKH65_07495, partial [Clostridia bacterium]|nr:hypothetical protein [Clostridia bacterium]